MNNFSDNDIGGNLRNKIRRHDVYSCTDRKKTTVNIKRSFTFKIDCAEKAQNRDFNQCMWNIIPNSSSPQNKEFKSEDEKLVD